MSDLVQKFFEKNIKKTWDGCEYDLDNKTEKFYYDLKNSMDDLEHREKKEREPSDFMKTIYQDPANQKTASYNTKETYVKTLTESNEQHLREWGGEADGDHYAAAKEIIHLIIDHDYVDGLDTLNNFVSAAEDDDQEELENYSKGEIEAILDAVSSAMKSGSVSGLAGDLSWEIACIMDDIDLI